MQQLARKKIVTFLVLVLLLSSPFYYWIISTHRTGMRYGTLSVLGLMWSPGCAALLTRLIYQKNLRGMGWGWGKTRYQLWSYAIPFLYALAAYLIIWLGGLEEFYVNEELVRRTAGQFRLASAGPALVIALYVGAASTLGMVQSCMSALGEEIGWRGLLVPELAKVTTFSKTALLSGAIWSLWHYPIIFFGGYSGGTSTGYSAACFTVLVVGISFVFAWMRLKSGSVWTGMLLHASHNLFIQGVFDPLTVDTTAITKYVRGEFGLALAAISVLLGFFFWRKCSELPLPTEKGVAIS